MRHRASRIGILFIGCLFAPTLRYTCVGLMEYRVFDTKLVSVHHAFPVGIRYPFRLVCITIEIDHNSVTQRLDFVGLDIAQALLHLEAGVAQFGDTALAHNVVMEMHGMAEIKVDMDENIFEGQPVDLGLEDMFEVSASTHVEEVALRPVVDVIVRVEVAHADLDGTGKHNVVGLFWLQK